MTASENARLLARARIRLRPDLWIIRRSAFGVSSVVAWVSSLGAHVLALVAVAVVMALMTGGGGVAPPDGAGTALVDGGLPPLALPVTFSGRDELPALPTPEPTPVHGEAGRGSGRGEGLAGSVRARVRTVYQSAGFPKSEEPASAGGVVTRPTPRISPHRRAFERGQSVSGRCLIDETGATLCPLLSAPTGQEESALRALEACRWEPALDRLGRPVRSWMTLSLKYEN